MKCQLLGTICVKCVDHWHYLIKRYIVSVLISCYQGAGRVELRICRWRGERGHIRTRRQGFRFICCGTVQAIWGACVTHCKPNYHICIKHGGSVAQSEITSVRDSSDVVDSLVASIVEYFCRGAVRNLYCADLLGCYLGEVRFATLGVSSEWLLEQRY